MEKNNANKHNLHKGFVSIITMIVFVSLWSNTTAQILHPVHWSYAAKRTSKNEAVIYIKATIDAGWHIYSVNQKDGGPIKTSFEFMPSKSYRLNGGVTEPMPLSRFEKAFDMDVLFFEEAVVFQQKITIKSATSLVRGKVAFMTCNDQRCLPPEEIAFSIHIK